MRTKTELTVRAAPGIRFPLEGRPRLYITDAEPRAVVMTPYYQRAVADGDLVVVETKPEPAGRRPSPSNTPSAE